MKSIVFFLLLFSLVVIVSNAQRIYSETNLRQSSTQALNLYLKNAQRLKKTGAVLSITGPVTLIAGFVVFAATLDDDSLIGYTSPGSDIGGWMILAGTGATLAGIPTLISGSVRVKRITRIMNENPQSVFFELAPFRVQNCLNKNNQLVTTVRIKF